MTKEKTCPKCGCTSRYKGNFCVYCGNKIEPMCHPCWVLGKDYDCQSNKCRYAEIKKAGEGVEAREFRELKYTAWAMLKATRMLCEKIAEEDMPAEKVRQDFNTLRYCATSLHALHRIIQMYQPEQEAKAESEECREELGKDLATLAEIERKMMDAKPDGETEKTAADIMQKLSAAVEENYHDLEASRPGLSEIKQSPFR